MNKARYSGPGRTGICICGHPWQEHHMGVVLNEAYWADTGERYILGECEHFGFNETGGLDAEGNVHCTKYVDSSTLQEKKKD